jgi:hypothetical protein
MLSVALIRVIRIEIGYAVVEVFFQQIHEMIKNHFWVLVHKEFRVLIKQAFVLRKPISESGVVLLFIHAQGHCFIVSVASFKCFLRLYVHVLIAERLFLQFCVKPFESGFEYI